MRKFSEIHRKRISEALLGNKHAVGSKRSVVTRKKIGNTIRRLRRSGLLKTSGAWKGGRVLTKDGYVRIFSRNHPYRVRGSNKDSGYVFEHRLVMESRIGRILEPNEVVHHINGKKDDNRPENLMLFSNGGDHVAHHYKKLAKV